MKKAIPAPVPRITIAPTTCRNLRTRYANKVRPTRPTFKFHRVAHIRDKGTGGTIVVGALLRRHPGAPAIEPGARQAPQGWVNNIDMKAPSTVSRNAVRM